MFINPESGCVGVKQGEAGILAVSVALLLLAVLGEDPNFLLRFSARGTE